MGDVQFAVQVTAPNAIPRAIPPELRHLVCLNEAFRVLICIPCKQAVRPGALVRHLKRMHLERRDKAAKGIWRKAAEYIGDFPRDYTHLTVDLPEDGSEAQAGLAIQEVWECKTCRGRPFRTSNWDRFQRHRVEEHKLQRIARAEMARFKVLAQSWFLNGRQEYWRIEKVGGSIVGTEPKQVPEERIVEAGGGAVVEGVEGEGRVTGIVVRRWRARESRAGKRRVTGVGAPAEADGECIESRGSRRMTIDDTAGKEVTMANSAKRRASISEEGGGGKRVRFAEHVGMVRFAKHVEIGELAGFRQQLDRWSTECMVCYFMGEEQEYSSRPHTIWACQQATARGIRRHSQNMDKWMKREAGQVVGGSCLECFVPRAVCEGWKWDHIHKGWVPDPESGCQYAGVLIPAIMVMTELGAVDGVMEVENWLRDNGVDPERKVEVCRWLNRVTWWEGVEAGQVVVELMMLAQANKLSGAL